MHPALSFALPRLATAPLRARSAGVPGAAAADRHPPLAFVAFARAPTARFDRAVAAPAVASAARAPRAFIAPAPGGSAGAPAFVAFGRARTGAAGALRARAEGVPGSPGRGAVTRRRPRTRVAPAGAAAARGLAVGGAERGDVGDGALREMWERAAGCGDISGLVRAVRGGFDDVGAVLRSGPFRGASAVHAGAGLAREDVVAVVFEIARGVGAHARVYGHRGSFARDVVAAADGRGRTALHYAAECDWSHVEDRFIADVVRRLVGYGVRVGERNDEGRTAMEVAESRGNAAAVRALRESEMALGG